MILVLVSVLHERHLSWKSRSGSHLLLIRVTVFISSIGLFTLFSVIDGNAGAVVLTTSILRPCSSLYILEPVLAGRKPDLFGIKLDKSIVASIFL